MQMVITHTKQAIIQYVSNKIKPRQRISFVSVLFYWIHTVYIIFNKIGKKLK